MDLDEPSELLLRKPDKTSKSRIFPYLERFDAMLKIFIFLLTFTFITIQWLKMLPTLSSIVSC